MATLYEIEARNPDGSGNNPLGGEGDSLYVRITKNSYLDGFGQMLEVSPVGPPQPVPPGNPLWIEPAGITDLVMAQPKDGAGNDIDIPDPYGFNEFGQFFGQYLTHDVAEAAGGAPPPLLLDQLAFPLTRTPADPDADGVLQQHNHETSFLDLSTVYGRSHDMLNLLRQGADGAEQSAYLVMGTDDLLPTFNQVSADSGVDVATVIGILAPDVPAPVTADQFAAGDDRLNQQPPLTTHHTVWARNHNWHVDQLKAKYDGWSEQEYFDAARAMNEAEWQSVVYDEYLARLIGPDALQQYSGYKDFVDPSVINEWTTIAFRFGHDQSSNLLTLVAEDGTQTGAHTLAEAFNLGNIAQSFSTGSVEDWLRGQTQQYTQKIDGFVVEGNRQLLFNIGGGNSVIVNLEVLDIARGRDHGMSRFDVLRDELGLDPYTDFDHFGAVNGLDQDRVDALKAAYTVDGVVRFDLFDSVVAVLLEKPVEGSMLGETNTLLNVLQFETFRDGDRLYYESEDRFGDHPELIEQIKETTMADILVRNTDMEYAYHDAFQAHNRIGGDYGNNIIKGTHDVDLLMGFEGNDDLRGRDGEDDLYGGKGDDDLRGGNHNDHLWGEDGEDEMYGNNGDDHLDGGKGRDIMLGGGGADHLTGGYGQDTYIGGGGDDVFDFNSIYESGKTKDDADFIKGFKGVGKAGGDVIDLSDIYLPGDEEFYFIGTYEFDGSGPQVRVEDVQVHGGWHTLVEVNTDYDYMANMAIVVDDGKKWAEHWVEGDFDL